MAQKWNLQDIKPPEPRRPRRPHDVTSQPRATGGTLEVAPSRRDDIPSIVIEDGKKKHSYRLVTAIAVFLVIVGAAIGVAIHMSKSVVTVFPEFRSPVINNTFTAFPERRTGELSYEILTLTTQGERQVTATGQIPDTQQATGFIEIIKTTPGSERLIKNTRFRSPDGLIFRIQESVVVPGAVTDGSGTTVPGTIRAEVFAEEAGDAYNLPAGTRFDIPGFQESGLTQLFQTMYAENRTAFTGGFDGLRFEIDEDELNAATQELQLELRDELLERIARERFAGSVYFSDSISISFNSLPPIQSGQELVTLREEATLQVPLFLATDLGSYLAQQAVVTYTGGEVVVDDISALTFAYTDTNLRRQILANEPSLSFTLNGQPLLIWQFDETRLAENLAGLNKNVVQNVFEGFPAIRGGRVHLTPFWRRNFPDDPTRITIQQELVDPR